MLDIRCELNGEPAKVFSVFGFMALTDAEQARLRQSLYCLGCGAKAYFRRAARDGKAACFGSLYHRDDCPEYHPSSSRSEEEASLEAVREAMASQEAICLVLDVISIDLDARVRPERSAKADGINVNKVKREAAQAGLAKLAPSQVEAEVLSAPAPSSLATTAPKLGLKKLLQSLLRGSELGRSDLWIYTDEVHRWRAKNLLVNFADAEPTANGAPRLYWGSISHADKELNWLNPLDNRALGIAISDIRAPLLKRFGLSTVADFDGVALILFGKCFYTKDKKRKIIKPWSRDPRWLYLLPPS